MRSDGARRDANLPLRTFSGAVLALVMTCGPSVTPSADIRKSHDEAAPAPGSARELESFRQRSDLSAQRRHVWNVLARITRDESSSGEPPLVGWFGQDAAFAGPESIAENRGAIQRGLAHLHPIANDAHANNAIGPQSAEAPILTYTLYNEPAYRHIRDNRLYLDAELARLRIAGPADRGIPGDRSVPDFPADAMVMKTAWWPVAREGLTPLPVWDAEANPPRRGGNDFMSWKRVVAIDPAPTRASSALTSIEFAGKHFPGARRVSLGSFIAIPVDASMAQALQRDPIAAKSALLVLGRLLAPGDHLILVGAHLATKEIREWVWGTLWWHDRADAGPFAAGRPASIASPWTNYLLHVAFDAQKPAAADGGPHVAFNPWLEARFPDGGKGGGTSSNCLACHQRASYPAVDFLPVTRGLPDTRADPAFARDRLRTNFIWAIALHAQPGRSH